MKNTIALSLLSVALVACDSAEDPAFPDPDRVENSTELEESTEDIDLRDDGMEPVDAVEVTQVEIARITLDSAEVTFLVDVDGPEAGQLTMSETAWPDEDGMVTSRVGELTPLQAYLALTDDDVPVPVALLEGEDEATLVAAEGREHTDRLDDPISARPGDLLESAPESWSAAFMCSEGTTSQQFLDEICSMDSWWNRRFCHNGTWFSVTDTSGTLNVDWARSRTLACNANGRVRHYYRVGGIFYKGKDETLAPGFLHTHTTKGSSPLRRKITHSRTASGFVRGYSTFRRFPF